MPLLKARLAGAASLLAMLCVSQAFAQTPGGPGRPPGPTTPRESVYCCQKCGTGFGSCSGCTEYSGSQCPAGNIQANCSIMMDKVSCSPKESATPPGRPPGDATHLVVLLTPTTPGARSQSFDVELRGNRVAGVSRITAGGKREPLTPRDHTPPSTDGTCSQGALNCWEDNAQMMSICMCISSKSNAKPQTIVN